MFIIMHLNVDKTHNMLFPKNNISELWLYFNFFGLSA